MFKLIRGNTAMPGRAMAVEEIVNRTFVTAHLLTGRMDLAETAILEAINAWNPDVESAEALFGHAVAAALRKRERRDAAGFTKDYVTHSYLPAELRIVLELRPALRRSFVLRLLARSSREDCADLLGCSRECIARAALGAVRLLPTFHRMISRGERMEHQEVDQSKIGQVAYDFWLQRGCPMGCPEEDWFRAEQKLRCEALDRESPVASIAARSAEA
jgi:hypothetical protein